MRRSTTVPINANLNQFNSIDTNKDETMFMYDIQSEMSSQRNRPGYFCCEFLQFLYLHIVQLLEQRLRLGSGNFSFHHWTLKFTKRNC